MKYGTSKRQNLFVLIRALKVLISQTNLAMCMSFKTLCNYNSVVTMPNNNNVAFLVCGLMNEMLNF